MITSNFANNGLYGLNGISIARYPDRRHTGVINAEFPPLMPSAQLLTLWKTGAIVWAEYVEIYNRQNLRCLNPQNVWDELNNIARSIGAHQAILLCSESAKMTPLLCHRRLVAAWFEAELGVVVPEWRKA